MLRLVIRRTLNTCDYLPACLPQQLEKHPAARKTIHPCYDTMKLPRVTHVLYDASKPWPATLGGGKLPLGFEEES